MKLHLIGICGTGMGAVAGLLKEAGHEVRGSDEHVYPPMSVQLKELGVMVYSGYRAENLGWGPDAVVVGNVCRRDHVEVLTARDLGLRLTSFPAIIEELLLGEKQTLVIAGTHGKTTTTALAAWILISAGRDPSYLIGGVPLNMRRSYALGSGPFVLEGDEYDTAFFDKKSKFLHYRPRVAVITSIELDHVDIFRGLDHMKESFREFVALLPEDGLLLISASCGDIDDVLADARCKVERYGVVSSSAPAAPPLDWAWRAAISGVRGKGRTRFDVFHGDERIGAFEISLPGSYNIENALSVVAALSHMGVPAAEIERGMRLFAGVRRRQELRGVAQGVSIVDDFAHHPTAIRMTLQGLRGRYGNGRLIAVFEPRSATSRTAVFQREFAEALSVADEVVIGPVHAPEKAPPESRLDTDVLAGDVRARGVPARALKSVDQIVEHLAGRAAAGDTVVVMSSGSFDGLHDRLLTTLGDAVVPAVKEDLDAVLGLLQRVGLPLSGVADHLDHLMVLRDPSGQVIGCVCLEVYGDLALLRSLAVTPERRGEGLGWMLAEAALSQARVRGLLQVYLLTEHATDFFAEKFGFVPVRREDVPEVLRQSTEFQGQVCGNAVAMKLDL